MYVLHCVLSPRNVTPPFPPCLLIFACSSVFPCTCVLGKYFPSMTQYFQVRIFTLWYCTPGARFTAALTLWFCIAAAGHFTFSHYCWRYVEPSADRFRHITYHTFVHMLSGRNCCLVVKLFGPCVFVRRLLTAPWRRASFLLIFSRIPSPPWTCTVPP